MSKIWRSKTSNWTEWSPLKVATFNINNTVGPMILLLKDGLEELALPFGENEVSRFGRAPFFPSDNVQNRFLEMRDIL